MSIEEERISEKISLKVVLLGEGCVGKTSLLLRYVQNVFQESHVATVQASFLQKRINIQGKRIEMNIWDTAGQERYHALTPIYYRNACGAILVYDITDADSFQRCQSWQKELNSVLGSLPIAVVGNKLDLEKKRVVSKEEAETFVKQLEHEDLIFYCETSAKLSKGVDAMFFELTRRMLANSANTLLNSPLPPLSPFSPNSLTSSKHSRAPSKQKSLVVLDSPLNDRQMFEPPTAARSSFCCTS